MIKEGLKSSLLLKRGINYFFPHIVFLITDKAKCHLAFPLKRCRSGWANTITLQASTTELIWNGPVRKGTRLKPHFLLSTQSIWTLDKKLGEKTPSHECIWCLVLPSSGRSTNKSRGKGLFLAAPRKKHHKDNELKILSGFFSAERVPSVHVFLLVMTWCLSQLKSN